MIILILKAGEVRIQIILIFFKLSITGYKNDHVYFSIDQIYGSLRKDFFLNIIFQGKNQTGAIKNIKEYFSVISFPCLLA